MKLKRLLLLFFVVVLSIETQSNEDLFQQVFKKSSKRTVSLPLFFNGVIKGEGLFIVQNSENIQSVQKGFILKILEPLLDEDALKSLSEISGENISIKDLGHEGVSLEYHSDKLIAELFIKADRKKSQDVNLAFNRIPRWAEGAIRPGKFSGFINFYNFFRDNSSVRDDSITADQNWNLNLGKLSFLAQTSFQKDSESRFIRQDLRFSYDDTKRLLRYQFGDLNYRVTDFQAFQAGAGLLVSTNFDLNPYRLFNPMSFREITLNTPSRVRVFVNGVLVQTLNLPSGRHRLDNLPLNEGINTIRLEIQDQRGRLENFDFKSTTSFSLIGQGIHDMTYGGGIPAKEVLKDRQYDTDNKKYFYILNHLYGLSNNSNIGFGLMGNSNQRLLSLRNLYQGNLGFTNLNLSLSQLMRPFTGRSGEGVGGRLTHVFRDYQQEQRRLRTFDFGLEYLGPNFVAMEDLNPNSYAQISPELGYTQFITDTINVRLRGLYRFNSQNSQLNFTNISSTFTLLFKRFFQFGLQYSYSKYRNGSDNHQTLLSFNWSMPSEGHVVTTSYNSQGDELNGQWNYSGRGRPGNWRGLANLRKNNSSETMEAELGREDQRYATSFNIQKRKVNGIKNEIKNLNFHTSLAFAGGEVSISRPINQGFALVKTSKALKGHSLYLNKNGDQYEAETGFFNSAVLPNYQAYRYYPVRIDGRNLPLGISAPPQELVVAPPYRGGVLIPLTAEFTRAVIGKIQLQGNSSSLKMGKLISVKSGDSYTFFTNRKGRFLVESVIPGEYKVFLDEQYLDNLNIDAEGKGFHRWEFKR